MAVTGKGNFPFNTKWVRNQNKNTLYKTMFFGDKDQSLKTIMEDWFFESAGAPPAYYGILKRWTSSIWIKEPLKTYLAASWQSKPLKRWDGSAWKEIDTTGV